MALEFDIDEAMEKACEGCPLVEMTHNGMTNGEQIDPPEYQCPCVDGVPDLAVEGDEIVCDVRNNS